MSGEFVSKLLQNALETIITVSLPIVLVHLVNWINAHAKAVESKMSHEQLEFVRTLVFDAVRAAEQSGLTGQLETAGAEKKAYVIALIRQQLEERGISINLELLDAMIEAAVHDAFNKIDLDPNTEAAG